MDRGGVGQTDDRILRTFQISAAKGFEISVY